MSGYEQSGYRPTALPTGIGCSFVLPTALLGIAFLADFSGPGGWHSLAEVFGWLALCAGATVWCAYLLSRFRRGDRTTYLFPFIAVGSAVAFLMLVIWEAHPETPTALKLAYTTSLQVIGLGSVAAALIVLLGWSIRRRG